MTMAIKTEMIQFNRGLSQGLSTFSDNTKLVNLYPIASPGERSETQLTSIFGTKSWQTLNPSNGAGCRGLFVASTGPLSTGHIAILYGVFGNTLYRLNKNGTHVAIGNVNAQSGQVSFAENQDQTSLVYGYVCDGSTIYRFDLLAEDADLPASFVEIAELPEVVGGDRAVAKYISYNGYRLILTTANSNQWYYTELNDDKWAGFESSESNPDKTVRAINFGDNIFVLSSYSYDIFSKTGLADDPYDVGSGASGKIGCVSGDTVAVHGQYMFWLGQGDQASNQVYMATVNGQIASITSPSMQRVFAKWQYQAYATGFCYTDRGQTFYVLTSKNDDQSFAYCVETKQWHQLSTSNDGREHYWDIRNVIHAYGKHFVGSYDSNIVSTIDHDVIQNDSQFITRYWQSPIVIQNLSFFKINEMYIDAEPGTSTSLVIPARIFIQISWDGGKTWSDRMVRSLGRQGQYDSAAMLRGGGAGKNLVLRIGTSESIPLTFYQIKMIYEVAR